MDTLKLLDGLSDHLHSVNTDVISYKYTSRHIVFQKTVDTIHIDALRIDNLDSHLILILLLLAAPTWLWSRCGRHNSPTASSVMDFVFRRSDGSHVSVDTVHPSLLRSSSLSSPGCYHLQSLSSYIVLVSPLYVAKPPQSRFPAPLCDTLYLQSLLDVIVSHMVS